MNQFSFASRSIPIRLPDRVEFGGKEYPIHTDFRRILLAMKAACDRNISPVDRLALLKDALYPGCVPPEPWQAALAFVRCGRENPLEHGDRDFDYEQDAAEIYSAFMQVYGMDLLTVPKLHWWQFCALLDGVFACDNALSNKVRLRHLDDSKSKQKSAVDRAKRNAALAEEISGSEAAVDRLIRERLKAGQPIDDLLRR